MTGYWLRHPEQAAREREHVLWLEVKYMHCPGCAENIGGSMNQIEGVESAIADHERGVVEIWSPLR